MTTRLKSFLTAIMSEYPRVIELQFFMNESENIRLSIFIIARRSLQMLEEARILVELDTNLHKKYGNHFQVASYSISV